MLCRSSSPCPRPANRNRRLPVRRKPQIIRIFLSPFESRFLPVNPQAQIVLISRHHLARPQHSPRPAFKPQQRLHVVVQPPPRHKNPNLRCHFLPPQARYETRNLITMLPTIPTPPPRTTLRILC